jgi:hypothetical protein
MSGIVYFIQPSEYISTDIYKIGYSQQSLLNRIKQYGNNTSIICVIGSNNALATEKQLISIFNSRFDKFKGKEYFIIKDIQTAKNIFYDVCNSDDMNISSLNTKLGNDLNVEKNPEFGVVLNADLNEKIVNKSDYLNMIQMEKSKATSYYCTQCNYTTKTKYNYECHLLSKKHKKYSNIGENEDSKDDNKYECKMCNYSTNLQSNYTKHNKTTKHKIHFQSEENKPSGFQLTEHMFYEILNSNKQLMNIVEKNTNKKYCAKCVDR